ncbi:MAG: ABC transporter substrate-binding protein [Lachnospiraceae bacterium]|nr:ABC transporter substrate-binding protein [Lachnospiraceae bacterium]
MKSMKKILAAALVMGMVICLSSACGQNSSENGKEKLVMAYQWGLAYAPLEIMKQEQLIEKYYDGEIEVEWKTLNGPAEIYEGMVAGSIDVAHSGVGPFLINSMKSGEIKMYSALSAQPMGLNTTEDRIQSIKDIKEGDKIALVGYGSIQHVMLAMACEKELGDPHALDNNMVTMSHPDGMQALLSGSVPCQLTTSPYFLQEKEESNIHEVEDVAAAFPEDATIIVGSTTTKLHDEKPQVYQALVSAMEEAMDMLNNNQDKAAEMLCEKEGVTADKMKEFLSAEGSDYDMKPHGTLEIAQFMERADFMEKAPADLSEICFDNIL